MKKDVTIKKLKTKVSIEFSNEQYQALVDSVNNLDTALILCLSVKICFK